MYSRLKKPTLHLLGQQHSYIASSSVAWHHILSLFARNKWTIHPASFPCLKSSNPYNYNYGIDPRWVHSCYYSVVNSPSLCKLWCFYHNHHNSYTNLHQSAQYFHQSVFFQFFFLEITCYIHATFSLEHPFEWHLLLYSHRYWSRPQIIVTIVVTANTE